MNKTTPISVIIGSLIVAAAILLSGHFERDHRFSSAPPSLDSVRKQFTEQFTAVYGYDGWNTPEGKVAEIVGFDLLSVKYSADLKAVELRFHYRLKSGKDCETTTSLQSDAFYNYTGTVAGRGIAIR
jgi:hypothetical protein